MRAVKYLREILIILQYVDIISSLSLNNSEAKQSIVKRSLFIYPGTKWCGNGNIAESCEDLGIHPATDKCCREHDYCPYAISKDLKNFMGFKWIGITTLSHCECDKKFFSCLDNNSSDDEGKRVIDMFFYGLDVKCFAYIPCEEDEVIDEPKYFKGLFMSYGECVDGIRIRVFNIDEYNDFIRNKLSEEKVEKTKAILAQSEKLMIERKLNAPCRQSFTYFNQWILENFERTIAADKIEKMLFNSNSDLTTVTASALFGEQSNEHKLKSVVNSATNGEQFELGSKLNNSDCQTNKLTYERYRLLTLPQLVILAIAAMILLFIFEFFFICNNEKDFIRQ